MLKFKDTFPFVVKEGVKEFSAYQFGDYSCVKLRSYKCVWPKEHKWWTILNF